MRFYNIGSGEFYHPCWTCIDKNLDWFYRNNQGLGTGIIYNLFSMESLPAQSATIELVYISHTLGLVSNEVVNFVLTEAFRILKPGGFIRIVTEDIDMTYRAWKANDIHFYSWRDRTHLNEDFINYGLKIPLREASITQLFLDEFAASASEIAIEGGVNRISDEYCRELFSNLPKDVALDYCISQCPIELQAKYPFRNMNWFNELKLTNLLAGAGFEEVYRSAYLQSRAHVLRNPAFFDKTIPTHSLYMEARKI